MTDLREAQLCYIEQNIECFDFYKKLTNIIIEYKLNANDVAKTIITF